MPSKTKTLLLLVLLYGTALGQAGTPPNGTFHVVGTIRDPIGAVIPKAKVEFRGKQLDRTVATNEGGGYEADLDFGDYTMMVEVPGFRPYHRPLFRAVTNKVITFNSTLRLQSSCDITVVRNDGGIPTAEDWEAAKRDLCLREESISIPSTEGFPFQVVIRFSKRSASGDKYAYTGAKEPYDDPVFVAYNLFSLEADRVVYDAKTNTIRAAGNVVAIDESGVIPSAGSMAFKLGSGKVIPIQ